MNTRGNSKGRSGQSRWRLLGRNLAVNHTARTTVAAMVSLLVARVVGLPEMYWAVMATMIVMQSSLRASLPIAWRQLAGTALGAVFGVLLVAGFGSSIWVFAAGLFLLGLVCAVLGRTSKSLAGKLDRAAYRFAGTTLAMILLISHTEPTWMVALHRFCEVSIGIAVAVGMTALWREKPDDG